MRCIALVLIGLAACKTTTAEVLGDAPAPTSSIERRTAYYDEVRPVTTLEQERIVVRDGMIESVSTREVLRLANGAVISDPAQILPAVGERSAAGRAALRSVEQEQNATIWGFAGLGFALGGCTTMLCGPQLFIPFDVSVYSGVALLAIAPVPAVVSVFFANASQASRAEAFEAYDASLREHLALE